MSWLILIKVALMGVIEGLTEFLPISSTGHLIIAAQWMHLKEANTEVLEVVIQLGAILAVFWEYRQRILGILKQAFNDPVALRFLGNIFIASLPVSLVGVFCITSIKLLFFNVLSVAFALLIGGVAILWIEKCNHSVRVDSFDKISFLDALKIGLIQIFSLIPGVSRSGSTIMGGLLCKLDRKTATEFSFFLAIPLMFAAAFYDGIRCRFLLHTEDIPIFAVGLIAAFFSARIAVRVFLKFVTQHTFYIFAWYRIFFGIAILLCYVR